MCVYLLFVKLALFFSCIAYTFKCFDYRGEEKRQQRNCTLLPRMFVCVCLFNSITPSHPRLKCQFARFNLSRRQEVGGERFFSKWKWSLLPAAIFLNGGNEKIGANAAEECAFLVISRKEDDPEEQALAPKFLSTSADMACTEGDQVIEHALKNLQI